MTGSQNAGPLPYPEEMLFSAESARTLDQLAPSWGLDPFALVEAAGRSCARGLTEVCPALGSPGFCRTVIAAGSGNNAADALVMLRSLITEGRLSPGASAVVINRLPSPEEHNPRSEALKVLIKMDIPVYPWREEADLPEADDPGRKALDQADLIIDGIAGTGLRGSLTGSAKEMTAYINRLDDPPADQVRVVSLDIPSGNFDDWAPSMPIIKADLTLAIEPRKSCLYHPGPRPFAGTIVPVGGIFPSALVRNFSGPEFITWERVRRRIPPILPDNYKYSRGVVEIKAGSIGSTGAAQIAARGAQAAGAGLVRLLVDPEIYPILAFSAGGVMVAPAPEEEGEGRFRPDAVLLGPGWGRYPDRLPVLTRALDREAAGLPLILDADAIALSAARTFHGNAILTPHPGEFAILAGLSPDKFPANPLPLISRIARERHAVILFKSHVSIIAGPDGRLGIQDGMAPVLAAGGTGDLLAGFCAALAARTKRADCYDAYTCAAVAVALLMEAAATPALSRNFADPLDLADAAARLAGETWLKAPSRPSPRPDSRPS
ncbi:MAG: bifunctional ADP-dependent NAD(P)H-hydrate dehydratase/NAD(P)H-hydrate epimerase [Spirochaetaceae bacterium]|jgi:NAD(P)H-hydrate epimerase|nr:bifunctional ADP-dependent NAD(P)H-hydrate dehydratase/NAD(P)H-hydrate epimerase [Spirochaetaceae bacterium]